MCVITETSAPALGDIRSRRAGDTIRIHPSARERTDWSRYVEAIAAAVSRGAAVSWEGGDERQ